MGAVAYDVIGKTDKVFDNSGPGLNCKVTDQQEFFGGCAATLPMVWGYRTCPICFCQLQAARIFAVTLSI